MNVILLISFYYFADIFNSLTNNRLAPVPEEQTEELLKAIEFPIIGNICEIISIEST